MDTDLKCNRLTCRQSLTDKAVVTTCSHIFCVECANELFNAARLCPACDTTLTEPDDVVVCSLHPSNDYKTSVLSGLTPSIILEICTRAISFWQYQIFQEHSFQQAVVRNLNDKGVQLQKQLDNVVREANSEIALLNSKTAELERDLELERRKIRELQDGSKEREREYQKLKLLHDKFKRKALLAQPNGNDGPIGFGGQSNEEQAKQRNFGLHVTNAVNLGAVVGGMEANGIQRTPLVNRTIAFPPQPQSGTIWAQQQGQPGHARNRSHRQPFPAPADRSYRSGNTTDHSDSANEVENLLINTSGRTSGGNYTGWTAAAPQMNRNNQQAFVAPTSTRRTSGKFRPAGGGMGR
ncbi:E3 ubiquitin-protein ligase CCNB1IP1 [Hypsizygus marmoreus]|uniref:E3 ubiquitin-protein ligase CCNB1IP1 n=1 Tax=Hypsizygus marmoreus TaxID=39966 RepID=A0A369JU93_HYPMA|nr:E3 ubiquitin-protein ligase CCNB1IP1 [Hypsizygus marmoreus]